MTRTQDTTPANPAQVTDAMVEAAEAAVYPRHERGFLIKPLVDAIDMHTALTAAIGAGGEPFQLVEEFDDVGAQMVVAPAIGAGGQAVAADIEKQAWECDKWPDWLHAIVDRTNEVADRLDMSSEQALAYAALSAIGHPVQPGWLEIESAPKDGDRILVIGGRHLEPEIVPADGDWWRYYGGDAAPTHWMPLPAAPQPKGE